MEFRDSFAVEDFLFDAEQVGPLHRPEIGELGTGEEGIDELGPFLWIGIGDEFFRLGFGRDQADEIEAGAPDKSGVVADFGRIDPQGLPFRMKGFVDEVEGRGIAPDEAGAIGHEGELHGGLHAEVANVHRGLARTQAFDAALVIDFEVQGRGFVDRPAVHVAGRPVGKMGGHLDLKILLGGENDPFVRRRGQLDEVRFAGQIERRAFGDPLPDEAVSFGVVFEALPALVLHIESRFAKKKAFLRLGQVHETLHHGRVVLHRILPAEREEEFAFPRLGAVAGSKVATGPGDRGNDVVAVGDGCGGGVRGR